jgi:hypothetical protein
MKKATFIDLTPIAEMANTTKMAIHFNGSIIGRPTR